MFFRTALSNCMKYLLVLLSTTRAQYYMLPTIGLPTLTTHHFQAKLAICIVDQVHFPCVRLKVFDLGYHISSFLNHKKILHMQYASTLSLMLHLLAKSHGVILETFLLKDPFGFF